LQASQIVLPASFYAYNVKPGVITSTLVGTSALAAIAAPLAVAGRTVQVLAGVMLAGSMVAVAWTGHDAIREGILAGAGVVAFILAAQVLGDALVRGGYDRLIRALWSDVTWRILR
jgi:hypothetical protein